MGTRGGAAGSRVMTLGLGAGKYVHDQIALGLGGGSSFGAVVDDGSRCRQAGRLQHGLKHEGSTPETATVGHCSAPAGTLKPGWKPAELSCARVHVGRASPSLPVARQRPCGPRPTWHTFDGIRWSAEPSDPEMSQKERSVADKIQLDIDGLSDLAGRFRRVADELRSLQGGT